MKTTTRSSGFTIIELVLVAVALCVLASLIALTASGVKAKNRNGERQMQIDTIRSQLESFYATVNMYPTFDQLNDSEWRAKNLPRLKADALEDPRWNSSVAACTVDGKAVASEKPAANCYSYQVTSADGSACDNEKTPCAHYTLTASLEGGEQYTKSSLN